MFPLRSGPFRRSALPGMCRVKRLAERISFAALSSSHWSFLLGWCCGCTFRFSSWEAGGFEETPRFPRRAPRARDAAASPNRDRSMLKLYRREGGKVTAYHEAWAHGSMITEHWGAIGERGDTCEHRFNKKLSEGENLRQVLAGAIMAGYEQ